MHKDAVFSGDLDVARENRRLLERFRLDICTDCVHPMLLPPAADNALADAPPQSSPGYEDSNADEPVTVKEEIREPQDGGTDQSCSGRCSVQNCEEESPQPEQSSSSAN